MQRIERDNYNSYDSYGNSSKNDCLEKGDNHYRDHVTPHQNYQRLH